MGQAATPAERISDGGHVSFFYDSPEERLRLLADYYANGLAEHELCVFVTSATPKRVLKDFQRFDHDFSPAVDNGDLRIFDMTETYLPNGKFVSDFMLTNVRSFLEDAERLGYRGLRTAGEMSWMADEPIWHAEGAHYESNVNGIKSERIRFTGLCLYPKQAADATLIKNALRTHPAFVSDEQLHLNPYYLSPARFAKFEADNLPNNAELWIEDFEAAEHPTEALDRHSIVASAQAVRDLLSQSS